MQYPIEIAHAHGRIPLAYRFDTKSAALDDGI